MREILPVLVLSLAACGGGDRSTPLPTGGLPPRDAPTVGAPVDAAAGFPGVLDAPMNVRSSSELKARLVITNPGPDALVVTRGAVDLPMIALEVRGADGKRVNPMPPPVPRPADAEQLRLAPGEQLVRDYLLNIYSPELPAGTYTLNCLAVVCAPVTFTVAP